MCFRNEPKNKKASGDSVPFLAPEKEFLTSNQHGADGEDLLCVCVSRHIPKSNTRQAAESEVQGCNIGTSDGWAPQCVVAIVWRFQSLSQLMKPTCNGGKGTGLGLKTKSQFSWYAYLHLNN